MADPKEPKKETVRITLPTRPPNQPPATGSEGRDTAQIDLAGPQSNDAAPLSPTVPSRAPPRPSLAQTPLPPAPAQRVAPPPLSRPVPPPLPSGGSASGAVASPPSSAPKVPPPPAPVPLGPGPKKETARISVLPVSAARATPSVEMKKTQPLVTMPAPTPQAAPLTVAPGTTQPIADEIPISVCWALLGVSAVILIIQIWNYFI
jgi:hypothetical protein